MKILQTYKLLIEHCWAMLIMKVASVCIHIKIRAIQVLYVFLINDIT